MRSTSVSADTTAWLLSGVVPGAPMSAVNFVRPFPGVTVNGQLVPVLHEPSNCPFS